MDLSAAALDIHELVEAYAKMEGTRLAQLKELWIGRSFSFIHESRPKDTTPSFFIQSLYSSALSYVKSDNSFSWKLGGLFVLYCLYETQLFNPRFLIYLSLEDLEKLHSLVKELKRLEHVEGLKVVQTMLTDKVFLFGCVAVDQKSISDACDKLAREAGARLKHARSRLLSNVPIKEHLYGDLAREFSLDNINALTKGYAAAKQQVFTGLGTMGVNAARIPAETLGDELNDLVKRWDNQRTEILSEEAFGGCDLQIAEILPPPRKQQRAQARKKPQEKQQARTEDDDLADEIMELIEQD